MKWNLCLTTSQELLFFSFSRFVWLFDVKRPKVSVKCRKYQYYHFSDLCCFVSSSGRPRGKTCCLQMYADHFINQFIFTSLLIFGVAWNLRCIFEKRDGKGKPSTSSSWFELASLSDIMKKLQSEGERFCNKTFVSFLHSENRLFFFSLILIM